MNKHIHNIPYFIAFFALTYVLHKPEVLLALATMYQYLALKAVVSILVIKNYRLLIKSSRVALRAFKKRMRHIEGEYYDMPIDELVQLLSSKQSGIKLNTLVDMFAISCNKAQKALKEMDSLGIFGRDSNNGRILNDVSRGEMVALLRGKKPLVVSVFGESKNLFISKAI